MLVQPVTVRDVEFGKVVRSTLPAKLFRLVSVTVDEPGEPESKLIGEIAEICKSPIWTMREREWLGDPRIGLPEELVVELVAVTVTPYKPGVAEVKEHDEVRVAGMVMLGQEPIIPDGKEETPKVSVPLNCPIRVTVITTEVVAPTLMLTSLDAELIENPVVATARLTVAELNVLEPIVPVTVTM